MINRFIIIAFFSFNFIFQVKAQYIEIDLRSDLKGSKNYFGIAARTNTSTGHAYVILGRENDEKQMTEINAQSFYPNHEGMPMDKGKVIDEFTSKHYVPDAEHQVFFILNDNDYETTVKTVQNWLIKPRLYNLVGNNCINLTQEVAASIGITLPSRISHPLSLTPGRYLDLVKNQLLSKDGLPYKKNSRIVSFGSKVYIGPMKNGKPNGQGREVTAQDIYVGEFKDGTRKGKGSSTSFLTENVMSAEFENGIPKSPIKTILKDGSKITQINDADGQPKTQTYSGIDGSKETINYGNGGSESRVYTTPKGSRLEQAVNCDKKITKATYTTASGDKEIWDYDVNGSPVSGTYINSNGSQVIIKKFLNNRHDSIEIHLEENGAFFDGNIWYDEKHSYEKGHITFQSGDTYDGELRDFKFHGRGHLVHNEEKDCAFLGLFCQGRSFDIVDDFENGSSPYLRQMGFGPSPSASFPDTEEWKVPLNQPMQPKSSSNDSQSKSKTPEDYSNLDKVPPSRTARPTGYNKNNSYWDPVEKKWKLL